MVVLSYTATVAAILGSIVACALARVLIQVLQLGIGGAAFLAQSHARHGDAFVIGATPPRLVFLFDPSAIRQFFTAPVEQIDFRAAVEHFTQRVFQVIRVCGQVDPFSCTFHYSDQILHLLDATMSSDMLG